jgi:hypothetical protein
MSSQEAKAPVTLRVQWVFCFLLTVTLSSAAPAVSAQSLLAGGAIQYDFQRFSGDPTLNRLDGSARGWTVFGGGDVGHLALRIEGSWTDTIENIQETNLNVDGQPLSIHSSLAHNLRSVAVMAGFTHAASSRVRLAYLAGGSFTTVQRTFVTDAAQLVLVSPSTPVSSSSTSTLIDRFTVFSAGADVYVRAVPHLDVVAGIRAQPLKLQSDLSGDSVRVLFGLSWRSR